MHCVPAKFSRSVLCVYASYPCFKLHGDNLSLVKTFCLCVKNKGPVPLRPSAVHAGARDRMAGFKHRFHWAQRTGKMCVPAHLLVNTGDDVTNVSVLTVHAPTCSLLFRQPTCQFNPHMKLINLLKWTGGVGSDFFFFFVLKLVLKTAIWNKWNLNLTLILSHQCLLFWARIPVSHS